MKEKKQVFSFLPNIISMLLIIALLYKRTNMFAVVNVGFMCICTVLVILSLIISKKPSKNVLAAYATSGFAVTMYYVVYGADAGFGAFSNCLAGWKSAENTLFAGEGNLGLRFIGNILLILPTAIICGLLFLLA
ncbi:MAG: hypothetical protein IKT61_04675, partial [Clostridia bacterium]|nr:hypothetical protein [Clostridia bacterium]